MAEPISPHFTFEELTHTAQRGLDNTPSPEIEASLKRLARSILEPVRLLVGPMYISSGYRSPAVNAAVGGSEKSQHMKGEAADWIPLRKNQPLAATMQMIIDSDILYDQIIFEFNRWIHISVAPTTRRPRRQALMIGDWTGNKYLPYDGTKVS